MGKGTGCIKVFRVFLLLRKVFTVHDFCGIQKAHVVDCSFVASVLLGIIESLVRFFENIVRGDSLDVPYETAAHAYGYGKFLVVFIEDNFAYGNANTFGNGEKTFSVTFT